MSPLSFIVGAIGAIAGLFLLAVVVVAFVQAFRDTKLDHLSRIVWLVLIASTPPVGAVVWFVIGERRLGPLLDRASWSLSRH